MAVLERIYNVPLRKGFYKAPKYRKTKKAMIVLQEFLVKHMKCTPDNLKIGRLLNETIWARGYKYPPHHVKLTAIKTDDGIVKAELFGNKYEEPVQAAEKNGKKASKSAEKDVEDLKKEVERVIDVDKVEEKAEKAEKKTRAKKSAEPKEEKAESEKTESSEEKPKKERKPRVKKTEEKSE